MAKLTEYEKSVRDTGKMNADRAMKKWGTVGWERISREMKEDTIGAVCLSGVFSTVDKQVDVQIMRDIYMATLKAAGLMSDE